MLLAGATAFFIAPFAYAVDKYLSFNGSALSGASSKLSASDLHEPYSSTVIDVGGEPVVVVNEGEHGIRAFTATCTHMGCTVRYRADHNDFYCKCHQGRFDSDGVNVPGTKPPSPLTELRVKQTDQEIEVTLTPKSGAKA